ncbi:MAG: cysteine desulfurase [Theionarchaea archaeon]|nr:cysteine desulfurase [Theionarchaea archaeon]
MNVPRGVRRDIPLTEKVAYFDNAATCLTPLPVIEAVTQYYLECRGNVHRGVHSLSEKASTAYEEARKKVAMLIHASPDEIIFVKNTTEALNYVSLGWNSKKGNKVITTELEHHSNFLPFFRLQEKGVVCEVIKATPEGTLHSIDFDDASLVTCSYVSNALGTILPVDEIGKKAKEAGALFCVDAAQAVGHMPVDVRKLRCDFLAFSGHKGCMGPTGVGVLYMKKEIASEIEPVFLGGGMIKDVSISGFEPADPPEKFEAGTPHIAGAIGLGAAIDYIQKIGISSIQNQERMLTRYTLDELSGIEGVTWYGPHKNHAAVISFNVNGLHPHDTASILDNHDILVRSGHHCALPLMKRLNLKGTVRASYHCYNTEEEVDRMIAILKEVETLV